MFRFSPSTLGLFSEFSKTDAVYDSSDEGCRQTVFHKATELSLDGSGSKPLVESVSLTIPELSSTPYRSPYLLLRIFLECLLSGPRHLGSPLKPPEVVENRIIFIRGFVSGGLYRKQ